MKNILFTLLKCKNHTFLINLHIVQCLLIGTYGLYKFIFAIRITYKNKYQISTTLLH